MFNPPYRPSRVAIPRNVHLATPHPSILMTGHGDEGAVLLAAALVHEEVVVSAAAAARIFAAGGGAGVIDRAAPFFGVEELADTAVVLVALAAHDVFVAVGFARVALLRGFERQLEVLS